MTNFNYKALNADGKPISGIVDAPSIGVAEGALIEHGFKIIDIQEESHFLKAGLNSLPFFNKVSRKDLVTFARQLAVMVSATVPIIQALHAIAKQTKQGKFKLIIEEIADDVDGGIRLSDALSKHSTFSSFFVNMVASGETSGKLDEVLEYLADETEKSYDLNAKIKGAMIYPAFIISGLLLTGIAAMIFIIPNLTGMLTESGQTLPLPTRILIGTSNFIRFDYVYLILILLILIVGPILLVKKTEFGEQFYNSAKLKFPVFGRLFQYIYVVRFSGTLSSLISAGVPLTQALKITSNVVGNYHYKKVIEEAIQKVEDGYSISDTFAKSNVFPTMLVQMLKVGEKTGRINIVLDKLSAFYSREVENMVRNLTSLLEPMIMVIIGIGVAGMVSAIIMPMYNMANSF